jgi:glyoxylase-like metal-dependent hydrolase (beta-lactamase superfamily II)
MKEPSEFRIENLSAGPLQTNTYLVTSGNESVLIDSGTAHQEIIEKLALSKRKVTAFVMTHGHFDHIMDAMEFKRKLGCKAMIGKGEDEILKWSYSVSSKYMGKGIENIELDRQLADGDLISLGSMGLKIVALPGHTAGSIGILAGSALFTYGGNPAQTLIDG